MHALFHPALPPGQGLGVPLGTVISYAGQVDYPNTEKNTAWPSCDSSTTNPCCAPQSTGQIPDPSTAAPVIAIEHTGWMLCDGRLLLISQYPDLFNVLGYMYGGSESAKNFALPDCRGIFLRGVDAAAGMDSNASDRQAASNSKGSSSGVGSLQCDALQEHQHSYNKLPGSSTPENSYQSAGDGTPDIISSDLSGEPSNALPPQTNTVRTSKETRPINIAMNYLIKFRNT